MGLISCEYDFQRQHAVHVDGGLHV